jgi:FMN-dependent NADH-azoreductase
MKTLLVINASARVTRSITRQLTTRFADRWRAQNPGAEIITRDVGANPPPAIDEAWIAAAFTPPTASIPAKPDALTLSDTLVDEIFRADAIVLGVPMYNFGMPGQLKAYIDQIVRAGRTFAFTGDESNPYQPLVPAKPMVIITAAGAGGYEPGGPSAHLNFLEPHLETVFGFLGLTDLSLVRVAFEEAKNDQFQRSIAEAEAAVDELVDRLASPVEAAV